MLPHLERDRQIAPVLAKDRVFSGVHGLRIPCRDEGPRRDPVRQRGRLRQSGQIDVHEPRAAHRRVTFAFQQRHRRRGAVPREAPHAQRQIERHFRFGALPVTRIRGAQQRRADAPPPVGGQHRARSPSPAHSRVEIGGAVAHQCARIRHCDETVPLRREVRPLEPGAQPVERVGLVVAVHRRGRVDHVQQRGQIVPRKTPHRQGAIFEAAIAQLTISAGSPRSTFR